jgi:ATP-dependent helicase HrpA
MPLIRYPAELPVSQRREDILAALREHQVVIVAGETGSGKTTQLPKMCLEAGMGERGVIGCTQPRRVAAMSISRRVAEELGVAWGREVGCKMRFNDDTSRETVLKFMTDGILLAELQGDPLLRRYSAIILDEAHERSLNIDFLLGCLKNLLPRRRDLQLIITSATIDTHAFSEAFGGAPIIEVSGRLFPVEIRYAPLEHFTEEHEDDIGFIEAAARATENALIETSDGDVLVFLPTERDIRDARDVMEGNLGPSFEILTLFGRMAGADQQRVFSPGGKRRVILATNIAETSLTIPRISFVIDAGLARMSRYNARTRTKRLPIEPVSQSSANQRAGRAGRVRDGVCVRLYSEEDFVKRPQFTQPEIQRANLAEVILRMKAFRMGEIESFPFLNPPASTAIRGGYAQLHELGALDDTEQLTPLGRELAHLPVDPSIGRMLLEARDAGVLPEVLVIAAGLSIPDPRERPEEAKEKAASAHRAFAVPHSDFLSLLRIWRDMPDSEGRGSRNTLRKFCRQNFLSFLRMTEWRDLHRQLCDAMSDEDDARVPALSREANDDGIHRSILAGLVGHIAVREERNTYKAAGNRLVTIFPGSHLYERGKKPDEKSKQPQWIVAGEIVQTSQLFARTVARIDPLWIERVAPHLCEHRFSEPRWDGKAGRVLVTERVLVHGLEIRRGQVDYGKVNAKAATEIFIRNALMEDSDEDELPRTRVGPTLTALSKLSEPVTTSRHACVAANLRLVSRLKAALSRARSSRLWDIEERLFDFYAARLENISSFHDLNRFLRGKPSDALLATETDLAGAAAPAELAHFPAEVSLGNSVLPITYNYSPGSENDGVTVQATLQVAAVLTDGQLLWMVPGHRAEIAAVLLRALPKNQRRDLQPIEPKAAEIARHFAPGRGEFLEELAVFLTKQYQVRVTAADWPPGSLPTHLQPRVEVVDQQSQAITTTRDLTAIRAEAEKRDVRSRAWDFVAAKWEQPAVTSWSFGDLPESIRVEEVGGHTVYAWPGLAVREGEVDVRLFRKPEQAAAATPAGIRRLAEIVLSKDLAWLHRELRSLTIPSAAKKPVSFQDALSAATVKVSPAALTSEILQSAALEHLLAHTLRLDPPLTAARFTAMTTAARRDWPALIATIREHVKTILDLRDRILNSPKRYTGMDQDAARLVAPDFLARVPHARLPHLTRYLKAVLVRAERAAIQPAKDADKAKQIAAFAGWEKAVPPENHEAFRWLLEEFRVSIFAQELGTAMPVSAKRLEALMTVSVQE